MSEHSEMVFHHGTMGSRKTLELMLDQYRRGVQMHHNTLIIKSETDKKAGNNIETRLFGGARREAIIIPKDAEATEFLMEQMDSALGKTAIAGLVWTIYFDEVNFMSEPQVLSLRTNVVDEDVANVELFGLLTDAFGNYFPGSDAAIRYSDRIIQLPNICDNYGCDRVAVRNARIIGGAIVRTGEQVAIDGIDASYMSLCHRDYAGGTVRPKRQ